MELPPTIELPLSMELPLSIELPLSMEFIINHLYTGGTLGSSEDPDEIPQNVAFHQGLHCLICRDIN